MNHDNAGEVNLSFREEQEIHLRDYLRVIIKRREVIIAFFLITLTVVIIATFAQTSMYTSGCKVVIEKIRPEHLADRYYGRSWDPEFLATQAEIINSKRVALRVVDMLDLVNRWDAYMGIKKENEETIFHPLKVMLIDFKNSIKAFFSTDDNNTDTATGTPLPEMSRRDILALTIVEDISVKPIPDTKLAVISYTSPNPQLAALIANSTTKAYIDTILNMKMESTRRTIKWMTRKAEEESRKLKDAEEALHRYMKKNDIITLENRLTVLPQKLSTLSAQLVTAQAEFEEYKALYQMVLRIGNNLNAAESISAISDNKALQALHEQILMSEKNIMTLSRKYGSKHPLMKKAASDLQLLKKKRKEEILKGISSIKNNFELARRKMENLQEQMDKTKAEALRLNERFIQYSSLKREVETNSKLYDALMIKIEEKSITEETQPVNLEIVERAEILLSPSSPRKMRNIALGIILGLFGGIGLAFFLEYLDDTVNYPEEAERILNIPVLGTIPHDEDTEHGHSPEMTVYEKPRSPLSESFRAIRTSILLSSAEVTPSSILITSPGAAEGKTTMAVNLAFIMAQTGRKVLLMDADLRKPRIHKIFHLDKRTGLSNYLAAGGEHGEIVQKGPEENLFIIPAGPIPPNPSELLSSDKMKLLISSESEKFDLIIIDSAPVISVADSIILSKFTATTILVTMAHKTKYDLAKRAIRSIQDVNSKLAGLIVNNLNVRKSDYYYHYYYSRYGHYGDEEEIKEHA